MLAAEEEYMLAKNWKTTGNIKAAEKLVTSHLRLVAKIAMGYVSIQYLTRPVEVLQSVLDALQPGGAIAIAMSHRLFPTKAIAAFQGMERDDKMKLVGYCLQQAGFGDIAFHDRSPLGADPLWIMTASKL